MLSEAAAAGSTKIRVKMAQAVTLAKLVDPGEVDWALGHAAVHARFAEADLASILDHHATGATNGKPRQAGQDHSLTQGTAGWAALGEHCHPVDLRQPDVQPGTGDEHEATS